MRKNTIKEWLERVALECGTWSAMKESGQRVANPNTRKLIVDYAEHWSRRVRLVEREATERKA